MAHRLLGRDDPCLDRHRWISEVTYVAALSLWALVSGHWSAWQAARVEVHQAEEMERRENEDLPGEIVERVVEETEVDKQEETRGEAPRPISDRG